MICTRRFVQRSASLLILAAFGVASIGGDGCFDWGPAPSSNSDIPQTQCCPAGYQNYRCGVQVQITDVAAGNEMMGSEVRCYGDPVGCSASQEIAESGARSAAINSYYKPGQTTVVVQSVTCTPLGNCGTLSPQDYMPLDYPGACSDIMEMDAGTSGASCTADGDTCAAGTDCCSGLCSEQDACEECRGPNEGCVDDSDCCSGVCSLNACGGSGLHLDDGGLGFAHDGGSP